MSGWVIALIIILFILFIPVLLISSAGSSAVAGVDAVCGGLDQMTSDWTGSVENWQSGEQSNDLYGNVSGS
jgi:hypothetical protein